MAPSSYAFVEVLWLAAVVLVPLAVNPWGFNYGVPKVALFRGLVLSMAAAHLLAYAVGGVFRDPNALIGRWLRRPLVRPILLVAGVALLSTLTSISPLTSLWGSYHRQQGAYLLLCLILWALLVAAHLRTPAQRRRLNTAVVVAGTLVALTPFLESLRWHENPLTWRPGGSLGNPIFLGAYLIMVIPFTLAQLITHHLSRFTFHVSRLVWPAALALQLLALLITQSRGPWVGALVGLGVFAALALWRAHRRLVLAGIAAVPLLTGVMAAGLNFGLAPAERLSHMPYVRRAVTATHLTRGTVRVRLVLWRAAAGVIARWPEIGLSADRLHVLRPLLGYGPDSASIVYTAAYPPELAHIEDPGAIWDRAHNELLDLLAMRGLSGLAATLALGVTCARRGLALWREARTPAERASVAAPMAALAAHAAETQFAFSVTATAMMSWLCVGWLASPSPSPQPPPSPKGWEREGQSPQAAGVGEGLRWRIYAAAGALLLAAWAARVEGGAIWADTLVARARARDRDGRWKESIELYDRALTLVPWQATWHQFRAEAFYNLARALPEGETTIRPQLLETADRSLSRARRLNPLELEHHSNAGILHAYWSDTVDPEHLETAVTFFRRAFRLAPTRARLRVDLGHVYHNHGSYQEALVQYRAALAIDPELASARYGAGLAWRALGRGDRARRAFQAALDLAPDCEACRKALHTSGG